MLEIGFEPKMIAKWIAGPISAYMTAHLVNIDGLKVDKQALISFFKLVKEGKLIDNQLKLIMDELLQHGGQPEAILKAKGFDAPGLDDTALIKIIQQVLESNPAILEQYKGGKISVIGFFVGQVMKQTQGKANPKQLQDLITNQINNY